jgi:hypothetical protein
MNTFLKKTIASFSLVSLGLISTLAMADDAKPANWYVNIDVQQFQNSELSKHINIDDGKEVDVLSKILGQSVANKTKSITVYGSGDTNESATAVAQGDYAGRYNAIVENFQALGLTSKVTSKYGVIYHGLLSKEELEKRFKQDEIDVELDDEEGSEEKPQITYAGVKDSRYIVVSKSQADVEAWLAGSQTWPANANGAMFEVVVDVQQALLHGGVNLNAVNDIEFESISAKQIKQVSVQYSETNQIIDVEIGLESHTVQTANQVTAVIRGLVALQSLASDNKDLKQLAGNLQVNQHGEKITLKLSGTAENFKNVLKDSDDQDASETSE